MVKTIDTLIEDIENLFYSDNHKVSEENLDKFAENLKSLIKYRLEHNGTWSKPSLRMSSIGTPYRKMWFEHNKSELKPKEIDANLNMIFLYGDVVEQLALLLAREAGHKVEEEQAQVEINGVVGHKDCRIDGVTTDVKSAGQFSFAKFADRSLLSNDPYGYVSQLSGYARASGDNEAAFFVINKDTGGMALLKLDEIDFIDPVKRIDTARKVINSPTPPSEKCYPDEEDGKSGNRKLSKNCNYCPFKFECWKDANGGKGLRAFQYSDNVKYLTEVNKLPKVAEITKDGN